MYSFKNIGEFHSEKIVAEEDEKDFISVVIIDESPIVTKGIDCIFEEFKLDNKSTKSLRKDLKIIAIYNQIKPTMIDELLKYPPDIILMEVFLKDVNSIEFLKKVNESGENTKVIFFSSARESLYAVPLIKAGAAGFISKLEDPYKITSAIQHVYYGNTYLSEKANESVLDNFIVHNKKEKTNVPSIREFEVLTMLQQGKSCKEIAFSLDLSEKTVYAHRSSVIKKLNINKKYDLLNFYR